MASWEETKQAFGCDDQYLIDNHFKPREWTNDDEKLHKLLMENEALRTTQGCPKCEGIGTFRARYQPLDKHPRYYVCKYCGYGLNWYGEWQYWPDAKSNAWGHKLPTSKSTPKELVDTIGCNPWYG